MKKSRRPEEIERVREKILDQALDIIVEQGLDGLTMRTLAGRTGMTAPNLYNYYSGKDAIYLSIVVKGFQMLQRDLTAARDRHPDGQAGSADRARAMMQAYLDFGLNQPRYYDIMFTLPTPKYNDYVGTPHETLSAAEYRISMDIVQMAVAVAGDALGETEADTLHRRVIQIWSLLHGMISLHNSAVVSYVADNIKKTYADTIDELVAMLTPVETTEIPS